MTNAGLILGTAAYMSPEQARGRPVDKRTDIWAFGCVLYEMLTGRRAFEGGDINDTMAAVLRSEPQWAAVPPEVPPAIRTLLMCSLEKDSKKRIADISTARFVLDDASLIAADASERSTATDTPLSRIGQRAIPLLLTALLTGVLVGGVAWSLKPPATAVTVTRFSVPLAEGQDFTNTGRQVIAISPDGARLVYVGCGSEACPWNADPPGHSEPCFLARQPLDSVLVCSRPDDQEDRHQRRVRCHNLPGFAPLGYDLGSGRHPVRPALRGHHASDRKRRRAGNGGDSR
jgi:hypothetical protein